MAVPTIEQLGDSDLLKRCVHKMMVGLEANGLKVQQIKEPHHITVEDVANKLQPTFEKIVEDKFSKFKNELFNAVDSVDGEDEPEQEAKPNVKESKPKPSTGKKKAK